MIFSWLSHGLSFLSVPLSGKFFGNHVALRTSAKRGPLCTDTWEIVGYNRVDFVWYINVLYTGSIVSGENNLPHNKSDPFTL